MRAVRSESLAEKGTPGHQPRRHFGPCSGPVGWRLDRKIEFPLPDGRQKRLVFATCTGKMSIASDVDLEDYVFRSDRISASEISAICQTAGCRCAIEQIRRYPARLCARVPRGGEEEHGRVRVLQVSGRPGAAEGKKSARVESAPTCLCPITT